jgi:hypothetical protein
MMAERTRPDLEVAAVHRTRRVVTDVTSALRILSLHEMAPGANGKLEAVALDPAQRRSLLVFLSELEEQVRVLEAFATDLAREIETRDRRSHAAATYQRTGTTIRRFSRPSRYVGRKVKQ